jgi:methylmalonyl-CoA mutase
MNNTKNSLFQDFNPVSKQEWIDKVNIDLKGADFNKTLVWKNLSKIDFQPFYTKEDAQILLNNTGENSQNIVNYRLITGDSNEASNLLALKAVEEGINGLLFNVTNKTNASVLLKGINLNNVTVSFNLQENATEFAKQFISVVNEQNIDKNNLKGYFNSNIITTYVTTGNLDTAQFKVAAELINITEAFPNFKALTISGNEFLNAGANQVQEIAYTLNALVFINEKLLEQGIQTPSIFNNLNIDFAIGSEYFIEIGKFRAFNVLLNEVAIKYGISNFSKTITAKTAVWNKSITDAHTNLLRATTEAMSAILGNVDGVLIDPYDKEFKNPTDFSNRIAGNITTILKEESYFGKVANPVDGSYYVEEVTYKIAEKALELFQSIESNGGFYASFESELIQQQIAEIRQEKIKLLSQRRLVLVGVNKYPNLMEKVSSTILSNSNNDSTSKVLKPRRASLEIEAIRKTTEELVEKSGVRPIVELASFGNLTMRKARAAFSYDFIGVSGFNVQQEKSFESAQIAAQESAKSNSHVVVICSSDQDYDESALAFVKTFRTINTSKVLLLAGAPANMNELTEAGLDGVVNLRSDVIETISNIQQKVKKTI